MENKSQKSLRGFFKLNPFKLHVLLFTNKHICFQAMLFLNFSSESFDAFKSKYHEVAELYKGKELSFLMGDVEASQGAFQVSTHFTPCSCSCFF